MSQYAAPPTIKPEETQPLASGVLGACGGVCVSKLFSEEDQKIATQVIRENGGTIVLSQAAKYLLAPLEGVWSRPDGVKSDLEKVGGAVVTMIWLVSALFIFCYIC